MRPLSTANTVPTAPAARQYKPATRNEDDLRAQPMTSNNRAIDNRATGKWTRIGCSSTRQLKGNGNDLPPCLVCSAIDRDAVFSGTWSPDTSALSTTLAGTTWTTDTRTRAHPAGAPRAPADLTYPGVARPDHAEHSSSHRACAEGTLATARAAP